MPWRLEKDFRFEAAHVLPRHGGKCARRHGHSWLGTLIVGGIHLLTEGPSAGMVRDFGAVKAAIQPLLDTYLDHYDLNETTKLENPTSEELARWIYQRVKPVLPDLLAVRIEETCTSRAEYAP